MKAKNNKGKPKFGIIVAVTETPVSKAYKKALKSKKKSKAPSMKKMQKEEDKEQTGY